MRIYNSLTRRIDNFSPFKDSRVGMYTCGPTVHHFVTVGNWRTYVLGDLLVRTLRVLGYEVDYVMNITDVGHLTGDNLGDADVGEDRMEKAEKREGKTAEEIARFYTNDFLEGYKTLNLVEPRVFCKATEHLGEQIEMVKEIEKKGYAYKTRDGIYFDTVAYEARGNRYGELSTLDEVKEGVRVGPNPDKKNPRDFALWKFSPAGKKRQMEWDSPWGVGFPGWHIECSAMSVKYLGEQFDVHVGGEDLRSTHHPNEIVQSEAATGRVPFVKYWVHGAFLLVDGGKMGKSLGNAYTLHDVERVGIEPLALRYFYLTGHYRKQLNFTWDTLEAAGVALNRLRTQVGKIKEQASKEGTRVQSERMRVHEAKVAFVQALEDDLNVPRALAVTWEVVKSERMAARDKLEVVYDMDRVLGLGVEKVKVEKRRVVIPDKVMKLVEERENYRVGGKFDEADRLREEINKMGYEVRDVVGGSRVRKKRKIKDQKTKRKR